MSATSTTKYLGENMSRKAIIRTKSCAQCSKTFQKSTQYSISQWDATLYCSRSCCGAAATVKNSGNRGELKDKFEALFGKKPAGCWEWQGTIDGYGYGVIDFNRRRYRAHVLALEYDGRPVTEGLVACHHCDNPRCVRPSHLYPGTPKDNVNDASVRGRLARGERHHKAKLTEEKVAEMRQLLGVPFAEIARRFGISRPNAAKIMKRELWRHVQ